MRAIRSLVVGGLLFPAQGRFLGSSAQLTLR
jgi:hypothetical protein